MTTGEILIISGFLVLIGFCMLGYMAYNHG